MNYRFFLLLNLFFSTSVIHATTLDQIALKHGTDKSSSFHFYTKYYQNYFEPLRNKPLKFLEIGFSTGASARTWQEYFPLAELFFIDVSLDSFAYIKDLTRVHLDIVDQENISSLEDYINKVGGGFDIIIDDGGHTMRQQIASFVALFPHVKSGGVYVIEDLHTSYPYCANYTSYYGCGNPSEPTTIDFLKMVVDCINSCGARTGCADFSKCSRELLSDIPDYLNQVESIHFYPSLVFIIKR